LAIANSARHIAYTKTLVQLAIGQPSGGRLHLMVPTPSNPGALEAHQNTVSMTYNDLGRVTATLEPAYLGTEITTATMDECHALAQTLDAWLKDLVTRTSDLAWILDHAEVPPCANPCAS
jgi:hypothetical protein